MGRHKIEIKRIDDPDVRQVTFSKRRKGLFSKANQLCNITGAEAAIMVFSPIQKKPYAYGHPSVDSVINRFLASSTDLDLNVSLHEEDYLDGMDAEDEKNKEGQFWWEQEVDHMDLDELMRFKASMEKFKKNVDTRLEEMKTEKALS